MWRRWGGEVRERVMLVAFSEGGRKNSLPTLAFLPHGPLAQRAPGQTGDREVHTWPWVTLRFTASRGRPIFLLFNWKDLVFPASHFAK